MKSPDPQYLPLVIVSLILLTILAVAVRRPFSYAAYFDACCSPPALNSSAGRFQQNAQVTVYIPNNSGLTTDEIAAIKVAMEDWNDEANNSNVDYQGEVTKTWATFTLWSNHRTLEPPSNQIVQLRNTARHEAGHGLGLDNANNCTVGSTIMNPSWTEETFITPCDNNKIDEDPVYQPSPTPTPEPPPTPTPELCRLEGWPCNYGDVCCNEQENWCNGFTGLCTNCPGQLFDGLCTPTPILIDVLGNGFELTSLARGVYFDLDLDGVAEPIAWTSASSDDAFLVLDRDGNGKIDDGRELFGDITPQPKPPEGDNKNGFLALMEFDNTASGGNGDGIISEHDSIFLSLRLWQDSNHNGVSEQSELHKVEHLGLKTIELDYKESKRTDRHGNKFKYRAKVKDHNDAQMGRWAWDVILVRMQ